MPLHDNKYGAIYRENEVVELIENALANPDQSVSQVIDLFYKEGFNNNEPCFVIRGQDIVAAKAIAAYGDIAAANAADPSFVASVRTRSEEVRNWQRNNSDTVKVPD